VACERCGARLAMDACSLEAAISTPSGQRLYLRVTILASASALHHKPVMFCDVCFVSFLEMFGQVAEAKRLARRETPTEGT
jgi:hypothetical protein